MSEMSSELTFPIIGLLLMAITVSLLGIWKPLRKIKGIRDNTQRSFAILGQALEEEKKRAEREKEALAVNQKLVEQGDETIALLNAIKDNLDHRSIKN